MTNNALNEHLHYLDKITPEPKQWQGLRAERYWGRDYGKNLLADINQLAHSPGMDVITRDCLKRAYKEISRLQTAKRSALQIADERAKENVALRAAINESIALLSATDLDAECRAYNAMMCLASALNQQAAKLR